MLLRQKGVVSSKSVVVSTPKLLISHSLSSISKAADKTILVQKGISALHCLRHFKPLADFLMAYIGYYPLLSVGVKKIIQPRQTFC